MNIAMHMSKAESFVLNTSLRNKIIDLQAIGRGTQINLICVIYRNFHAKFGVRKPVPI